MKLRAIAELLNARIVCGEHRLEDVVNFVFASDLMSDVLTVDTSKLLLLTGLTNIQTIRTSEMADIMNIVIVRDKRTTPEMEMLARENNMVIMECRYSMFRAGGILYEAGLKPVY